jgi:hypothetical protein
MQQCIAVAALLCLLSGCVAAENTNNAAKQDYRKSPCACLRKELVNHAEI